MLRSLEPGGPTREDAVDAFLAELPSITADGAALILDDFHLADEVVDIRTIVREIVTRGPERLSIVFASRRTPSIPVAKLRSLGELAELGIADLRFSDAEMEQLFRETYGRALEPDVLSELAQRTEGWAASLTLVQAALRERSPAETRSFVRTLSGAHDELHDYLAEEVVGDLPDIQQQFLMRTSLLQRVTPELAQVATGLDASEVASMITEAERLGLLGRRAKRRTAEQRYHPLVREFLEDRLRRDIGDASVMALNLTIARWAEPTDWRTAAHHFAEAADSDGVTRVLESHLVTILGSGAFVAAGDYLVDLEERTGSFAVEVIRGRLASVYGDAATVMNHANRAVAIAPESEVAQINMLNSAVLAGEFRQALELAERLATSSDSPESRMIGEAARRMFESSMAGDLNAAATYMERLADRNREAGHSHFEGVSLLNASLMHKVRGAPDESLAAASRAADVLAETSSGTEYASAAFAKAWALGWSGDMPNARRLMANVGERLTHANRVEYFYELAELEATIGDVEVARQAIERVAEDDSPAQYPELFKVHRFLIAARDADRRRIAQVLASLEPDSPTAEPGRRSKALTYVALGETYLESDGAAESARRALEASQKQGASLYAELAQLIIAVQTSRLSSGIRTLPSRLRPVLSIAAELVTPRLADLDEESRAIVYAEAAARRDRWLPALRRELSALGDPRRTTAAAELLDEIGEHQDVAALRAIAKQVKGIRDRSLGRGLARRLAAPVEVQDLGRVRVRVGRREVPAGTVRRKVLALLCFLLTRPAMAAAREEVMDALWPEMDPTGAANSLNQTIYFLRRVFEPEYDEETSPGYVRQESDVVWLDGDLINSTSRRCSVLVRALDDDSSIETVEALSAAYVDRFATDFAYEEWAVDYREWLHVSYLHAVESAIRNVMSAGAADRSVGLARRALETEPRLESLGLSLLKVLKATGSHAAAAEQYERYAALLRQEIGVEPPPYDAF
jgi:ATP/maltotriose-dependent transcriptional regulator MalT/DNA-binding SARP family transcriptional activator